MSHRRLIALVVAILGVGGLPGCLLLEPWGEFWHQVRRNAKPSGEERRDYTEDSQEQWKVVGEEGRKGQTAERDPDQWYREYLMSEKARSIEENLGFE